MALVRMGLKPGINEEVTRYADAGQYYDADSVRFRWGFPEQVGGWQDTSNGNLFAGACRSLMVWVDLSQNVNVAVGTNSNLYVWRGGQFYDITPIISAGGATLTNPFTTFNGSTTVQVTHVGHGRSTGDTAIFTGTTIINGVTINGSYVVTKVDDNNYTITVSTPANADGAGLGGVVAYQYPLGIGYVDTTDLQGYGTGGYGTGMYGLPTGTGSVTVDARTWSLDTWGEILIACYRPSGVIYEWDAGTASIGVTRATAVTNAPSPTEFVLVTSPDRHMVAFGTSNGVSQDKMYVAWSNQEDRNTWTPTATNTAGDQRLNDGSKIMGAHRSRGETLIWTDNALHTMQFIGPPFTFGFQQLGTACGAVSPACMQVVNGIAYWMSFGQFMIYDGQVRPLPCSLHRTVFNNINSDQIVKVMCGVNPKFNEIWWFYPSGSSTEINAYVAYDYIQNIWTKGTISRTAWYGDSVFEVPIAADINGYMYFQETGTSANGAAMSAFLESGEMDIGQGDSLMFIDKIIPDVDLTGTMTITLTARRYPLATEVETKGPFTITNTTQFICTRLRGRQARFRLDANGTSNTWRFGAMRFNVQPDGRR